MTFKGQSGEEKTLLVQKVDGPAVDKGALDCTVRARVTAAIFRSAQSDAYEWEVK